MDKSPHIHRIWLSGDAAASDARRGGPVRLQDAEAGFMLVAVVVMAALVLIALAIAAPILATELRRDKELESIHRAQEYVRAIRLYQRKFPNQYPASIKILEGANDIRYLRKQYVDPLTGKADWRLIHQGEQKTKIHVFFGEDLPGLTTSLGSAAGSSSGIGASSAAAPSSAAGPGSTSGGMVTPLGAAFSGAGSTSSSSPTTAGGAASGAGGVAGTNGATGTTGSSSNTGSLGDGSGGVIVGVGTAKTGTSISQPNAQTSYETWEFWYDPRIEQLRAGVSLTGGGVSSTSASSFGQNAVSGQANGPGATSGTAGAPGAGASSSPFGSTGAGSFGSSTPTSPSTPP